MKESTVRGLLWANFLLFVGLEVGFWIASLGVTWGDAPRVWIALILSVDLLIIAGFLTNNKKDLYWYMLVVAVLLAAEAWTLKVSSLGYLFLVVQASYLVGCLAVKGLCRWLRHDFSLGFDDWEVLFNPKNLLMTVVLVVITGGLSLAFGVNFTKV